MPLDLRLRDDRIRHRVAHGRGRLPPPLARIHPRKTVPVGLARAHAPIIGLRAEVLKREPPAPTGFLVPATSRQDVIVYCCYAAAISPYPFEPVWLHGGVTRNMANINKKKGVIGILTGGGDVPGLNPAIRGVTFRALREGYDVIGLRRGWGGLVDVVRERDDDNNDNFQVL